MPCLGFGPTIPASERAKTVHALDRSATVTGSITNYHSHNCSVKTWDKKLWNVISGPKERNLTMTEQYIWLAWISLSSELQQIDRVSHRNTCDVTGTCSTGHSLCGFSSRLNRVMNITILSNAINLLNMQSCSRSFLLRYSFDRTLFRPEESGL
jgi:hypothetical protein